MWVQTKIDSNVIWLSDLRSLYIEVFIILLKHIITTCILRGETYEKASGLGVQLSQKIFTTQCKWELWQLLNGLCDLTANGFQFKHSVVFS